MFELTQATNTKIADVVVLSQKNRQPDDNPGAKISVVQLLSNDMLAHFDGNLRAFLFTKNAEPAAQAQGQLEGVPPISDYPDLTKIGQKIGALHWAVDLTGYTVTLKYGTGGVSDLVLKDCTLSNWRFLPKEGGTVEARYDIESNDVSEKGFGRLAKLKSCDVDMVIEAPRVAGQTDIDDVQLTPAQLRKANTAGKTVDQAKTDAKADAARKGDDWPFPRGPKPTEMPAQKKDATSAVLEDVAKRGVTPAKKTPAPKPAVKSRRGAVPTVPPAAYRDPRTGQTWTGRGLKPKWLAIALALGKTLADFEVAAVS